MAPSLKRIRLVIILLAVCLCALLIMLIPDSARSASEEFSIITLTSDMSNGIPGDYVMFIVNFSIPDFDASYNGWDDMDPLLRLVEIGKNVATSTSLIPVEDYPYEQVSSRYLDYSYSSDKTGDGVYLNENIRNYYFNIAFWLKEGENFVINAPEGVDIGFSQYPLSYAGAYHALNVTANGTGHTLEGFEPSFDIFIEGVSHSGSDGRDGAIHYPAGDPVNIKFNSFIGTAISVTKRGDAGPGEEFDFTIKDEFGGGSRLVDRWSYLDYSDNEWIYFSGLGGRVTGATQGEFALENNKTITFFKMPPLPSSMATPASIIIPSVYTATDEPDTDITMVAGAHSLPDYRVTEEPAHGYITTNTLDTVPGANPHYTNNIKTGSGRNDVVFTNVNPKGVLEVSKALSGNNTEANREFNFTITFNAAGSYVCEYSDGGIFSISSGDSFTLKGGEWITIIGIPVGSEYTVTETDANSYGYATTPSSGVLTGIISTALSEAKFTNSRSSTGGIVTPSPSPDPEPDPRPRPTTSPTPPPADPPPPPADPEPWEPPWEPDPEPPPSREPWIEFDENGVPTGRWEYDPDTDTWIFYPFETPLGDLPQTGEDNSIPFLSLGFGIFLVCAGDIVVTKYRHRRMLLTDF